VRIREGTLDDLETICHHRRAMFHDMGHADPAILDPMIEAFRPWLRERLAAGEYGAWFVEDDGQIVAGAGLWLMPWPPHLHGPAQLRGNILNVYTEPSHRGRGHARRLMDAVLDWCRGAGIGTVILHASEQGRPLYASLGFQNTNEMRLDLKP